MTAPSSLATLKEMLDPSHIVLGTDLGAAPKLMASLVLSDLKSFHAMTIFTFDSNFQSQFISER